MPEERTTPTRGVPVELDRTRHLRYSLGTVRKIMEEFEVDDPEKIPLDVTNLGKFLWYGLKHEDPDLTVEDVEEMVDMQNIVPLHEAVGEAMGGDREEGARPPTRAATEEKPKKPRKAKQTA